MRRVSVVLTIFSLFAVLFAIAPASAQSGGEPSCTVDGSTLTFENLGAVKRISVRGTVGLAGAEKWITTIDGSNTTYDGPSTTASYVIVTHPGANRIECGRNSVSPDAFGLALDANNRACVVNPEMSFVRLFGDFEGRAQVRSSKGWITRVNVEPELSIVDNERFDEDGIFVRLRSRNIDGFVDVPCTSFDEAATRFVRSGRYELPAKQSLSNDKFDSVVFERTSIGLAGADHVTITNRATGSKSTVLLAEFHEPIHLSEDGVLFFHDTARGRFGAVDVEAGVVGSACSNSSALDLLPCD